MCRQAVASICLSTFLTFGGITDLICAADSAAEYSSVLTNLYQLRQCAEQRPMVPRNIDLIAEVCDVDASCNALVLRDSTGIEFIKVAADCRDLKPGTKIRLEGTHCGIIRKGFGLAIIPGLVVDNDGIHPSNSDSGKVFLRRGLVPFAIQVFNQRYEFVLNAEYEGPGIPRQPIPNSAFFRLHVDPATGKTNFSPGLVYRYYEGFWSRLPDFSKLQPTKSGVTTNLDIGIRLRNEGVAIEFTGFLKIPQDGIYTFYLTSDDGSRLYLSNASARILLLPPAGTFDADTNQNQHLTGDENIGRWMTLEGIARFTGSRAEGGEMILSLGTHEIRAEIFESCNLPPTLAPHRKVRLSGLYKEFPGENSLGLRGLIRVLSWGSIQPIPLTSEYPSVEALSSQHMLGWQYPSITNALVNPITTIGGVKELHPEVARQQLPVRIRGVVIATFHSYINAAIVQDFTRGVFVSFQGTELSEPVRRGELYEIEGVTSPGDFAPVIVAKRVKHLGVGKLPEPLKPTLNQLFSGAIDTEYVELDGFVVAARDQELDLLTPEGEITLILDDFQNDDLSLYQNAFVRIRGCAMALFNTATRQLTPGSVRIVSGAIEVVQPPPSDIFATAEKKISELLLYDPKATPLKLIKVRGQIISPSKQAYFVTDATNSILVSLRKPSHDALKPGDIVEAVGFIDWSGPILGLKKALVRKVGQGPLPTPIPLDSDNLLSQSYAGKLVKLKGRMINAWHEGSEHNLELQSGFVGFKARVPESEKALPRLRVGSLLELTGVYVPHVSSPNMRTVTGFELLMHSPDCIRVLANPPWLTLKRALYMVGILIALLVGVLLWNIELHKKVQERTTRLENEIRKRQMAELQHAAEIERSRIARDLHDELGAGLTAISLLASVGIPNSEKENPIAPRLKAIAEKARNLVEALDIIVWAVDPKRDSLQSFTDYVAGYAKELLDTANIMCRLKIPIECDGVILSSPIRHSLFLGIKEALNNIVRHANATEVELVISIIDNRLEVMIKDNGQGFDWNSVKLGNGLRNLQNRLVTLGGECIIDSKPGMGTTVKLTVPLETSVSDRL